MKIVHIAPNAPYNERWGYQENLLPKYQARLGHEVTLIVTNLYHESGKLVQTGCSDTISADGFRVIRKQQICSKIPLIGRIMIRIDVYELLRSLKPDFIFFHGLVSTTIFQVTKYKRKINRDCVIVQDNHLDYNNFKLNSNSKFIVFTTIYRLVYRLNNKYISKVYGVTPWRKTCAEKIFGVPQDKTDILIMGADNEEINLSQRKNKREKIRLDHGIGKDEFLIVTGGKIDERKKIHILMQVVNELPSVKLLVFGNVMDDVKNDFDAELSKQVRWVGWIDSDKVYDYFFAADLIFFPGLHSVLWEQACASKIPCVFSRIEGTNHVNNGGNADFIDPVTKESINEKIRELMFTEKYYQMKSVAESANTDIYLYSNIALKSIETALDN